MKTNIEERIIVERMFPECFQNHRVTHMNIDELYFTKKPTFKDVVNDGFENIEDGEGFEYIVGKIKNGLLKVVFEPDCSHSAIVIDGVDGFGYTLVSE